MAFEIHGFLRGVNLGHEKQIVQAISLHLVWETHKSKNPKTQIIHILSKPSWVDFSKTCQLSQFKAKNYLARNCKNQMFFDDQLIILTAYTVSLSYIVTQFRT